MPFVVTAEFLPRRSANTELWKHARRMTVERSQMDDLVHRIAQGHRVTAEELRRLLDDGCDAGLLVDALVSAAQGPQSRAFHQALSLLRDVRRL